RRAARMRRVGHAGTLDPLATGVLLVCLGRATRLVEYLTGQPKTYEAVIRMGQTTDTYDAEGTITAERPITFTEADLAQALTQFRGDIEQVPPMYSAIKRDGQPLYKLARQGKEVERPSRPVTIYNLDILNWQPPLLSLRITCSKGTYIRSLAHDLGEALGCGGHIVALRRTAVGDFTLDTAVPLNDLKPDNLGNYLLPMDTAVSHLPRLDLPDLDANRLLMGQTVSRQPEQPAAELVRAYGADGRFIGVVRANESVWQAHKMFP
ncbi:MAG TPA: tRNA pseudouridine(55) synthase TruB, partial [Chloroflexi bacterium]|nr:tRNA pseudouridine(55) synthase TruB [Chloroflexota bacterium]